MKIKIAKYQKKLSVHNNWVIYPKPKKSFKFCIVVPCYAESKYISNLLDSLLLQNKSLIKKFAVILVVNNSDNTNKKIINDNYKTIEIIESYITKMNIFYINAFSGKFALPKKKSGVGFARKIGVDLFIPFLESESLICFTDADVILDSCYLEEVVNLYIEKNCSAFLVDFKHQKSNDQEINKYISQYEKYLRHTAESIKKTGSRYGYISIGSCMGCTLEAYISVGGVPPLKATEDFYFLQALAKYCRIIHLDKKIVFPSSRNEMRVYLGTGFRINQLTKGKCINSLYYSNQSYKYLKSVLTIFKMSWIDDIEQTSKKLNNTSNEILKYFEKLNFVQVLNKIKLNATSHDQYVKQIDRWFDALKTIKFLKYFST